MQCQTCSVTKTSFGRYILTHAHTKNLAWTGTQWSEVDSNGIPIGEFQVSNFASVKEATDYASQMGLTVIKTKYVDTISS